MTAHFNWDTLRAGWSFKDAGRNEVMFVNGHEQIFGGTPMNQGNMMPPGVQLPDTRIYFVDATFGNDGNNGHSWRQAKQTFEAAIDLARFTRGSTDVAETLYNRAFIFMAPGHYDEQTQLLWSGHGISVIGCGGGVPGKDKGVSFNYSGNSAATAAMLVNGSGNELFNFHLYCDFAAPALYIYFPGDNNWIHRLVIECDGTNCTYGIYATSMKGSWIEDVTVDGSKTAGICAAYDAADQYAINGGIAGCHVYSNYSNTIGIKVAASLVVRNFWIKNNFVQLGTGSSCKGISCESNAMVANNFVSVPASADPIYHTGGDQYVIGNHTAAGTVNVDPEPAAG